MVDLAQLVVRLVADTNRFRSDIDRSSGRISDFARRTEIDFKKVAAFAAGAGAAVGATLVALAKSAIDAADNLNDLSKQTGVSTESLSQLQYAAEQSGTNLEELTIGLRKFVKEASDAAAKAGTARESFELIGVSVKDSAGNLKSTEQLLLDVAEQFSQYKDGAAKAAFAQELFGKSGAALIPFLNEGRAGIEALMKEADRLGITLSSKTAQAADDFNDQLNKLGKQVGVLGKDLAERVLPALNDIAKAISALLEKRSEFGSFLDGIAKTLRVIAAGAIEVGSAFTSLGKFVGAQIAYNKVLLTEGREAADAVLKEYFNDQVANAEETNKALARIWGERAEDYKRILGPRRLGTYLTADQLAANANTSFFKKPDFPTAKAIVDPLQEVEIRLKKVKLDEDVYRELHDKTQTSLERAFQDFKEKKAALQVLKLEAQIDTETFNARLKDIETDMLGVLTKGPLMAKEEAKKLNEFQLEAARNTQDIIANTFESLATGADISAKSILQSFGQMIVRLAAQAAAANLAGKLFGEAAGGAKGSSGFIGAALGALGFGGSRDVGGRGMPGMAYAIGTGAQPELFIPDRPGTFVPSSAMGRSITNNFTVVTDQPLSKRTQLQIAAAAARGIQRANLRNN